MDPIHQFQINKLVTFGHIGGAERVLLTAVAGVRRADPTARIRVVSLADGPLVDAVRAADAEAWYYEPLYYEGEVLYSASYPTEEAAKTAADVEFGEVE